jgi:hypothetical protein
MAIATGIAKQVVFKKEASWGVAAGATGAQYLRRVTSDLSLAKETYQSNEIRTDYQISDFRHGVRSVEGTIAGELSPLTYDSFIAAALRKDFVIGATTGALAVFSVTNTGTKFTRSSGSFVTDGFKVGDVISATGFSTANNNTHYVLVTVVAALTMDIVPLDGTVLTDEAAGGTRTIAVVGKKTYTPETSHTDDSFTFEHFYSDVAQSEVFTGCKVNSLAVSLPPTGMATINIGLMGKDITTGTSAYFTTPTAATTSGVLASVNGIAYAIGTRNYLLTGLNINYAGNLSMEAVVGSNTYPDIFEGRVVVTGDATAYFENGTLRDAFLNETEVALMFVFTTNNTKNPEFLSFVLPRVKFGGAGKDDGEKGLIQTIPFQGLFNSAGTGADKTTLIVQDSLAA